MTAWDRAKSIVKSMMPASALASVRSRQRARMLQSAEPASRCFGVDRGGTPIDRHYIEGFLALHAGDIRGRVMEIGDATYTEQFGGKAVQRSDVLHVNNDNPGATLVGDLATGQGIPPATFDCILCTQTLMFIYDVRGAVASIHRALRPGGVALITVAGISQIARFDMDHWGDFWRFTSLAAQRLFADEFGADNVHVQSYGNSFAAVCLLQGVTCEEMTPAELDQRDRDYEVIVAVKAVKRSDTRAASRDSNAQ